MIKSSNLTLYKSRYSELPDSIVDNERKIAEAFLTTEVVKSDELPFYTRHFMKNTKSPRVGIVVPRL